MTPLQEAQAQLAKWQAASLAAAEKQEYQIDTGAAGGRSLKYADPAEIRKMIDFWQAKVNSLTSGRHRTRYLVPR